MQGSEEVAALVLAGHGSEDLSEFLKMLGFVPNTCRDPNGHESVGVSAEDRINFFKNSFSDDENFRAAVVHLDDLHVDPEVHGDVIQAALSSGKPVLFVTENERRKNEIRQLLDDYEFDQWEDAPQIYLEPLTFMLDVAIGRSDGAPIYA